MSKRSKEILELVEWSADASMESAATGNAPCLIGVFAFGALATEVGFDAAERLVIAELTERFEVSQ